MSKRHDGLTGRWRALQLGERAVVVCGALSALAAVAHQLVLVRWYIEDAAISFTFARNVASGEGLVAYPGGERVEGYSNPLWTAALALGEVFGVSSFTSSKVLAAVFVALTVALMVDTVRLIQPRRPVAAMLTGVVLAANPQLAIWGASGLENSLFSMLLAVALWLWVRERRTGGWPLSALAMAGVALTRPEGIVYAAIFGAWVMASGGRWRAWALTFLIPFGAHQLWRQAYFGWPLPNTYYAKMSDDESALLSIHRRGWRYVLDWATRQWQIGLLPLWFVATSGLSARRWIGPAVLSWALVLLALAMPAGLVGDDAVISTTLYTGTLIAVLLIGGIALPISGRSRSAMPIVGLCLHLVGFGVFFAVYANGDWMKGWRWMSLVAVPISALTAIGTVELAHALFARLNHGNYLGRAITISAAAMALIAVITGLRGTFAFAKKPETGPFAIERRVQYMHRVQRRLHLDRVVNLDVDMGGTMWWSGHELVDIAGLIDVPMAHHDYQKAFIREYIFFERRPDFAHAHGGWASKLGFRDIDEWARDYLELPAYPVGRTSLHAGNFVAKRHLVGASWSYAAPQRFAQVQAAQEVLKEPAATPELIGPVITLLGWHSPTRIAQAGGSLFLEVAFGAEGVRNSAHNFRAMGFLAWPDHEPYLFDIAPGYDWYEPHRWQHDEDVVTRIAVPLPDDLPTGRADLGFIIVGRDGVIPALETTSSATRVAHGERVYPGAVRVESGEVVLRLVLDQLQAVSELASLGDCQGAEQGWATARSLRAHDHRWVTTNRRSVAGAIAGCWLGNAVRLPHGEAAAAAFLRSRWWQPGLVGYNPAAEDFVTKLVTSGTQASALGDWPLAYRQLSQAVAIDPRRSDARRLAERARDERLRLMPRHSDPMVRRRDAPIVDEETR